MTETQLIVEIEQQAHSYIELTALYQKTPSIKGFIEHMKQSYE